MKIESIDGELGRYFATSESTDEKYLVDLMENPLALGCAGFCGCQDWAMRRQPLISKATHVSAAMFCKHLEAAQAQFGRDMAWSIFQDQQKRAFTKTKT